MVSNISVGYILKDHTMNRKPFSIFYNIKYWFQTLHLMVVFKLLQLKWNCREIFPLLLYVYDVNENLIFEKVFNKLNTMLKYI